MIGIQKSCALSVYDIAAKKPFRQFKETKNQKSVFRIVQKTNIQCHRIRNTILQSMYDGFDKNAQYKKVVSVYYSKIKKKHFSNLGLYLNICIGVYKFARTL